METEITIKDTQKKNSKNNKEFLAVTTDEGRMSCWNPQIFNQLIAGKRLLVKVEEENGFRNILGIEKELTPEIKAVSEYIDDKSRLMELAYAKDILVALLTKSGGEPLEMAKLAAQMLKEIKKELK